MRTRKTLNKLLLRKLALKLRRLRHEEHYGQGSWGSRTDCGTAACIAGHAVLMEGWRFNFSPLSTFISSGRLVTGTCLKGKRKELVSRVAACAIGIPEESFLFSASPNKDWPIEFAQRWRNGKERPSRIAADLLDAIADGKVSI